MGRSRYAGEVPASYARHVARRTRELDREEAGSARPRRPGPARPGAVRRRWRRPRALPGRGQSRLGNYGSVTAQHHNLKTHGGWQASQPFPGTYLWRDPHGATYLVDHRGTRRVGRVEEQRDLAA